MELVHARGGLIYRWSALLFFGEKRCETEHFSLESLIKTPPHFTKTWFIVIAEFHDKPLIYKIEHNYCLA